MITELHFESKLTRSPEAYKTQAEFFLLRISMQEDKTPSGKIGKARLTELFLVLIKIDGVRK